MENIIIPYIKNKKNKTISIEELSRLLPGDTEYKKFATYIKNLQKQNILIPVKSHKMNGKSIPLYNTYRINKSYFKSLIYDRIQSLSLKIHPSIDLQNYYSLDENQLDEDMPFIRIINEYISENGLPKEYAFSPQRSYEIMGDEKWIDEKGGKAILTRLNLWEKLKIEYRNDPLMVSINPGKIICDSHKHLIVENKSSFYDFLDVLKYTDFSSLIYGCGWKITSNITMLEKQLGLKDKYNKIYYFGDLDYEGIAIWNSLKERVEVILATSFYRELLKKPATKGKENQNKNKNALNNFLMFFNEEEGFRIKELLSSGCYYPQELLMKEEIKSAWRKLL